MLISTASLARFSRHSNPAHRHRLDGLLHERLIGSAHRSRGQQQVHARDELRRVVGDGDLVGIVAVEVEQKACAEVADAAFDTLR